MNPRISTSMLYQQHVSNMLNKQVRINHLGRQLESQQRLITAKDDPVAAGSAQQLDRSLAALEQFGKNANSVQSRLGLQENALEQANNPIMSRVKDLIIEANSGVRAPEEHQVIAREIENLRDNLLDIANSTDGNGRYLFAGAADADAPFTRSNEHVNYHGDQLQRQIEIAPNTFVKDAQPGSDIFMRIRTGTGSVDASATPGNTGTGVVMDFGRENTGGWNGEHYEIKIGADKNYQVLDSNGKAIAQGTLDGEEIRFSGLHIKIQGEPAEGDTFSIGPAGTRDIFATLDHLIAALNRPTDTATGQAQLQNALQTGLRDVSRAGDHFIDARATIGAQQAQIDNTSELRAANTVALKTSLSAISDLDFVEAYGEYHMEKIALQAAQSIFAQMQSMSLFNRAG